MSVPIAWRDDALELLDQTLLPGEERVLRRTTLPDTPGNRRLLELQ